MLWMVLKTPSQETKKLPDFTWCQSFHVLKGFRESGPICMNNWELPFHWWARWEGQKEGPAASLLLLLVHTFIQVFHYILRAGPIPQECTRQHIRARVRWRWSRWQEKVSQVILGAVYEEGHKAYNKRGFIDRGQLTISTLGQRKGTVGVLSSHLPTPNLYSRNGTSKMA